MKINLVMIKEIREETSLMIHKIIIQILQMIFSKII